MNTEHCQSSSKTPSHSSQSLTVYADRLRMVWLWLRGKSARQIALETGASLCTVYRWVRRWQEEGNVETRPYRGRSRNLAPGTVHHTHWIINHQTPWTSITLPTSHPYLLSSYDNYITAAVNGRTNDYVLYKVA